MRFDLIKIGNIEPEVIEPGMEYIVNVWLKTLLTQRGSNVFNLEIGTNIFGINSEEAIKECIETAAEITRETILKNISKLKPKYLLKTVVPTSIIFDKGAVYIKVMFYFTPASNISKTFKIDEEGVREIKDLLKETK